ncbi:hypothetical protein ES708_29922 [subsurface metagenome]
MPPQFLVGVSPLSAQSIKMPGVPLSRSISTCPESSFRYFFLNSLALVASAIGIFIFPLTAIAFSFLEPITAPSPERPAARPLLFITAAMRATFSPAGPMQATSTSLPSSPLRMSSVWKVSLPVRWAASLSSALPLSMKR